MAYVPVSSSYLPCQWERLVKNTTHDPLYSNLIGSVGKLLVEGSMFR